MTWTVGAITTYTCGHQSFANLVWRKSKGAKEEGRCVAGLNTTWIKHNSECPECQRNEPEDDPVIISQPPSPLLDAPDNLEDRRGTVTEFRCGHHRFNTEDEDRYIVLGMDRLGFLLIQSRDECSRCQNKEQSEDDFDDFEEDFTSALSRTLSFTTQSSRPQSVVSRLSQRQDDENPRMRTYQPVRRGSMDFRRPLEAQLDPRIELLTARERKQQRDLDEMMLSTTFDLSPESDLPKRKQSKREKAKAIGKSIWGSIKRNV
ncbi:hypothetical protein EAF04_008807 [Stromatinia cepivora]|nr:hypothetical protein EAF04_008807 [Stromatinia cepivora]